MISKQSRKHPAKKAPPKLGVKQSSKRPGKKPNNSQGLVKKNLALKKLPIGVSDFKLIREEDHYYVDKSLFIKEIIDNDNLVLLLPRPRRFGKTLNLSMLLYFFEKPKGRIKTSHLFQNLKIWQAGKKYQALQGKFPVIYLSFKDVKNLNWEDCFENIKSHVQAIFNDHKYLLKSKVLEAYEKEEFKAVLFNKGKKNTYENSLKILTEYLHRHHQIKPVLLIDEYDTPIQSGYLNDYYPLIINFMKIFLSAGLKDNRHLKKGVMTGILRVAKESIFTGMNNLGVFTLLDREFSANFGFTEAEVKLLFKEQNLSANWGEVQSWYNGYLFGNVTLYNPWSILNYIQKSYAGCVPYWVNTSSNDLVRDMLSRSSSSTKQDLESLMQGLAIRKEIRVDVVFSEIEKSSSLLWSFLLFCGYLKVSKQEQIDDTLYCDIQIPNKEVRYLFKNIILQWFENSLKNNQLELLLKSLVTGDVANFEEILQVFVMNSMSFMDPTGDEPEKVYHAFVLGLLLSLNQSYDIKSNRESGLGRYDVMLIPKDKLQKAIVIEFKKVSHFRNESLADAVKMALSQIEEKKYESELRAKGLKDILKLGIALDGKLIKVGSAISK